MILRSEKTGKATNNFRSKTPNKTLPQVINAKTSGWNPEVLDITGAPEGIRIPDLLIRSQTLYPAELRARIN